MTFFNHILVTQSQEHIPLRDIAKSERFTTTSSGGGKPNIPKEIEFLMRKSNFKI